MSEHTNRTSGTSRSQQRRARKLSVEREIGYAHALAIVRGEHNSPMAAIAATGNAVFDRLAAQLVKWFGEKSVAELISKRHIAPDDNYLVGSVARYPFTPTGERNTARHPYVSFHFGVRTLAEAKEAIRDFVNPEVGHLGGYGHSVELLLDLVAAEIRFITLDPVDGIDLDAGRLELVPDSYPSWVSTPEQEAQFDAACEHREAFIDLDAEAVFEAYEGAAGAWED
jgi:hypothetical protein